jgi:hypothetical protein
VKVTPAQTPVISLKDVRKSYGRVEPAPVPLRPPCHPYRGFLRVPDEGRSGVSNPL